MRQELKLTFDSLMAGGLLAELSELANRFPEFGELVLGLIDSGDELFCLKSDCGSALRTGEIVVLFKPSDRLAALVSAFRARNIDESVFEHDKSSVAITDKTTTRDYEQ